MDRALEGAIDRMLEQVGEAVDGLQHDELDVELMPGKLTIDCGNGVRLVLSRQSATGQIWFAEPDGGWHFDLRDGRWIDDKRGIGLIDALEKVLAEQLGQAVALGHA